MSETDLKYWHRQLSEKLSEIADHEQSISRLKSAIASADATEARAVGALLAAHGEDVGGREQTIEDNYRIARGRIAERALPTAEEDHAAAIAEAAQLRVEVTAAAKRQLVAEASAVIAEYDEKIIALCETYDKLVGIKGALVGEAGHRALEIPLFKMTPHAENPTHRHGSTDTSGNPRPATLQAQADWTKALDKLIADPSADLSDLIGA